MSIYGQHISYDLANVPVMPFTTERRSPQLIFSQLLPYAVFTPEGAESETVVTLPEETLPIVSSEMVWEKTLILDFTDRFDGGTAITEEMLRAAANDYIHDHPLGAAIPTVKVSFEPLWKQPEYSSLLEKVNLCDIVTIRHSALECERSRLLP